MGKRMLIDAAHPEETRVVVLSGNRLEEFDFESSTKKQVKGNIYLAKVTRVEPSLQAAFIDYGGNRHGFLAFSEIHPDYYRIPVSDRGAGEYDAPPAEDGSSRETAEPTVLADEASTDEAPGAIADALPEAVPVAAATEENAVDAEIAGAPDATEEMAGEGPAAQDLAVDEAPREPPDDALR